MDVNRHDIINPKSPAGWDSVLEASATYNGFSATHRYYSDLKRTPRAPPQCNKLISNRGHITEHNNKILWTDFYFNYICLRDKI